jgi:CSLREA domain-containing protein
VNGGRYRRRTMTPRRGPGKGGTGIAVALAAALLAIVPAAAPAATVTVSTTVDEDGGTAECALREAITAANLDADHGGCTGTGGYGDDTIDVPAGDYALLLSTLSINDPGNTLTIAGAGSGEEGTNIDAGQDGRVFRVAGGGATLTGLEATGGVAGSGGGILADASTSLTLDGVAVVDNEAGFDGGGVLAFGTLAIEGGSRILDNTAGTDPTAIVEMGGGVSYQGASATDSLTVTDSTFAGNSVLGDLPTGGGLAVFPAAEGQTFSIDGSEFSGNGVGGTAFGGGLALRGFSGSEAFQISDSRIAMNEVSRNDTGETQGAGIWMSQGELDLQRSEVTANTATQAGQGIATGAGMWLADDAGVIDSVISGNDAVAASGLGIGGGIDIEAGNLTIERTTFADNSAAGDLAAWGGGIHFSSPGTLSTVNSTISGNDASDSGADPPDTGEGGAIRLNDGTGSLVHTTIAANTAETVGDALRVPLTDRLNVRASVLDGADAADVCSGDVDSGNYNVARGGSCALEGEEDAQSVDPLLAELGDNGGPEVGAPGSGTPIETHSLADSSPAVDRVAAAECTDHHGDPLFVDARGFPRPYPTDCDAGAYERITCGTAVAGASAVFGDGTSESIAGTPDPDLIFGMGGSDQITSGAGDDVVCAGPGDDLLEGGLGQDTLIGEAGQDRASYADRGAGEPVTARIGTASGNGNTDDGAGDNLADGIEVLIGGQGDDTLGGDGGANELAGGGGSDTADYSGGGGAVQINLGNGTVTGAQGADALTSIENGTGSAADDLLVTGVGDNHFDGGGGADTASFEVIPASINANLATGVVTGQATTQDTLANVENLRGSEAADVLTGDGAANVLEALGGNDSLTGAGGADTLRLGAGDDTAAAQDGATDTIDCSGGGADQGTFDISPPETWVECPNADGDALLDLLDACPTQAAATTNGCPAAAPPAKKKCKKGQKRKRGKCVKKKRKKKKP